MCAPKSPFTGPAAPPWASAMMPMNLVTPMLVVSHMVAPSSMFGMPSETMRRSITGSGRSSARPTR